MCAPIEQRVLWCANGSSNRESHSERQETGTRGYEVGQRWRSLVVGTFGTHGDCGGADIVQSHGQ